MIDIKIKNPTQSRSKAVIDAILEASTRILISKGMEKLTTNHIAEVAGVSIGSLYQYFANKESIVVKLIESHKEKEFERITNIMTQLEQNPTCQISKCRRKNNIRLVIKEYIDIHTENLELMRILHIQEQNLAPFHSFSNATLFLTKLLHSLLDKVDNILDKNNLTRAYVLASSFDSIIQKTIIDQPQLFIRPEFTDELVNLSMGYLQAA